MNKTIATTLAANAAAAFVPFTVTPASATGLKHEQARAGAITIESWLSAVPSQNVLSGTVWDNFKVTGRSATRVVAPVDRSSVLPRSQHHDERWDRRCGSRMRQQGSARLAQSIPRLAEL